MAVKKITSKRTSTGKALFNLALAGIISGGLSLSYAGDDVAKANKAALKKMEKECKKAGGKFEKTSCKGKNSCAGSSFDPATGAKVDHECGGKNSCAGGSCLDASKKPAITKVEGAAAPAKTTLEKYIADCKAAGKEVIEHACHGKATCGGSSFNSGTGETTEHSCHAKNSCAGASCKG